MYNKAVIIQYKNVYPCYIYCLHSSITETKKKKKKTKLAFIDQKCQWMFELSM